MKAVWEQADSQTDMAEEEASKTWKQREVLVIYIC